MLTDVTRVASFPSTNERTEACNRFSNVRRHGSADVGCVYTVQSALADLERY